MTNDNLKTNKSFNNVFLFHEHFFIKRLYAPVIPSVWDSICSLPTVRSVDLYKL